jgi:hypothetical protein
MVEDIFDHRFDFLNLDSAVERSNGAVLDICTVRSKDVSSASLGNLYWAIVAARFAAKGSKVNIYDFPNNFTNPKVLPIQEIVDLFELEGVQVKKAEEQDQTNARNLLIKFAQRYRSRSQDYPGIHDSVSEGLLSKATKRKVLDRSLDRMVEELAVFLTGGNDPKHIQLMGHEKETVQLIRYLGDFQKQYWQVDLGGIVSEFRAIKIPTIEEFPDRLLIGKNQGDVYFSARVGKNPAG